MSVVTIPQLPVASLPLTGSELIPMSQGGITVATPLSEIESISPFIFSSVADLRANVSVYQSILVEGYYGPGTSGGGFFCYVSTDTTSPDNGGRIVVDAAGHRYYRINMDAPWDIKWYGAYGDDIHDDTAVMVAWYSDFVANGAIGYLSKGTYLVSSQLVWDVVAARSSGIIIVGAGLNQSVIDLGTVSASPGVLITNSDPTNHGAFYSQFLDFSIVGTIDGTILQVGQESFIDSMNGFNFRMVVKNLSSLSSVCAVELNSVLNSQCWFTTNCSSTAAGDSVRLCQTQFSVFGGSYSRALNGLHLTNGYNYGNCFLSLDLEVVGTCVAIDSVASTHNNFIGGQYNPSTAHINATAGNNNIFRQMNFAGLGGIVAPNAVGVVVEQSGIGGNISGNNTISPSPLADSLVALYAATGFNANVKFNAGTYTTGVTSNRWVLGKDATTESGGNTGSNFHLAAYDDTGLLINSPIYVIRATGLVTLAGGLSVSSLFSNPSIIPITGDAALALSSALPNQCYTAYQTDISTVPTNRWFSGKDNTAESGANAGSNYFIERFADNGVNLGSCLKIFRSTGIVELANGLQLDSSSVFGAFGVTAIAQPTVSGSRGSATVAVLASLLTALNDLGLIKDATTA